MAHRPPGLTLFPIASWGGGINVIQKPDVTYIHTYCLERSLPFLRPFLRAPVSKLLPVDTPVLRTAHAQCVDASLHHELCVRWMHDGFGLDLRTTTTVQLVSISPGKSGANLRLREQRRLLIPDETENGEIKGVARGRKEQRLWRIQRSDGWRVWPGRSIENREHVGA